MIKAVAEEFFASFLDVWDTEGSTISPEVRQHYIDSSAAAVDSIVADYRASAGIDLDIDRRDRDAKRTLAMPVGVISQDWGARLGFDAEALWRAWAPDMTYEPIDAGHFMAEQKPAELARFIRRLAARRLDSKQRTRDIMAHMSQGRSRAFFDAMAEDVIWRWMGVDRWSRTFEGKQTVVDTLFGGSTETLGPSSRIIVHGIYGDRDVVVVEQSGRNELPNGRRYDNNYCWVFHFQDGLIREVREYMDTQLVTETFATDDDC